jgi:hypothetical protein
MVIENTQSPVFAIGKVFHTSQCNGERTSSSSWDNVCHDKTEARDRRLTAWFQDDQLEGWISSCQESYLKKL